MNEVRDNRIFKGIAIVIAVITLALFFRSIVHPTPKAIEVESYTEGYEVMRKEYDSGMYYLTCANDFHRFVSEVTKDDYAKYHNGDIVEVEVKVMDSKTDYFNTYKILGLE